MTSEKTFFCCSSLQDVSIKAAAHTVKIPAILLFQKTHAPVTCMDKQQMFLTSCPSFFILSRTYPSTMFYMLYLAKEKEEKICNPLSLAPRVCELPTPTHPYDTYNTGSGKKHQHPRLDFVSAFCYSNFQQISPCPMYSFTLAPILAEHSPS